MIKEIIMSAWTILTTTVYTILIGIPIIVTAFFSKTGIIPYRLGIAWAWLIMKTNRVRIQIEGFEKIIRNRSYVFIANHSSNLDPPAIALALQNQLRFVGKKSLARIPVFGWAIKLARMILIDRSDGSNARNTINKAICELKDGISACFFAEGTRSLDGRLQKFKKGGVMLALKARLPIVPVTVVGSHNLLPKNALHIKSGMVRVIVGDPIDTSAFSEHDRDELIDTVRSVIMGNLQRLSKACS
ncbi:MAG TPA: 1-acyl-sn-glycerol-3-phosphate acyltransferase [Deltaproteobacteria bacterium]|nr:1-acyl-sn-glycerol-3-phosphate acyltransferase [Deltaproteobacteria bacterium]